MIQGISIFVMRMKNYKYKGKRIVRKQLYSIEGNNPKFIYNMLTSSLPFKEDFVIIHILESDG